VSHGSGGDNPEGGGRVIDLTRRLRIEDTTSRLATDIITVLERYDATPVEYFAALALAGRALRTILTTGGMPKEVLQECLREAVKKAQRYQTTNEAKNEVPPR
jgi:hypothetical protein